MYFILFCLLLVISTNNAANDIEDNVSSSKLGRVCCHQIKRWPKCIILIVVVSVVSVESIAVAVASVVDACNIII